MAQYRKKPVVIEAITFNELVAYGITVGYEAARTSDEEAYFRTHAATVDGA